jgi:RNA polymerase sigma-70 factor (ECF subfamily)
MDTHTPDHILVAAFIDGDSAAFGIISERYRRTLLAQAYLVTRDMDTSHDVVQHTFLQAMKALMRGAYKESGKFSSWLYTNHRRNSMKAALRKVLRAKRFTTLDAYESQSMNSRLFHLDSETLFIEKELRKGMYAAINALDPQFRESLLLRTVKELKYEEIAQETGVNINTIRTRLRLGTKKVKALMQKADLY